MQQDCAAPANPETERRGTEHRQERQRDAADVLHHETVTLAFVIAASKLP
jgi:hypothetical protein